MKFRNMSIRARLSLAFGGLALVVLGVSVLALSALAEANARFTSYTTGLNARAAMAAHVRAAVDDRAIAARNLVLVNQEADLAIEKAAVTRAHEDVKDSLALLNKMLAQGAGVPEQARQLVGEIDKVEQAYGPVALAIVDLALKGQREQAIARMNNDCRPLLAALVKAANAYAQFTATRTRELEAAAAADYAQQRNLLGALCLAAVAAAMLAGWLITRSITRPLGQAVAAADRIAAGDLGATVAADATDETGRLLSSLQRMQQSLVATVGTVRSNADSVSVASREIAQGNNDLSQRTEEQASALQQTAASMEELNNTVRTNADNARQAGQLAATASQQAVTGGDVVGQVVQTMKGITHSSDQISEIISVIDGIAFQTNILALNAAVEAARAGEQGRGFAVVAAEVRALAQRSAQAAKEIKVLITDSAKRVEQGSALVDRAGAAMQDLVGSVQRVSHIMGEISAASAAQSESVSQIGMAIHQMDQATQQNAALVEESAAAAASLKAQAEQLVEAVAVFHLEPQPLPAAEPALAPTSFATEPATPPSVAPARAVVVERRGPHRAANVHRLPQAAAVTKAASSQAKAPKVAAYQAPALPRTGTDDWAAF